jgi:ABC-type phosphate transport system, periplasmic component
LKPFTHILYIFAAAVLFTACNSDVPKHADSLGKGNINISVDETYTPIIKEQLKVFDSSFPEAHVNAAFKAEGECFKDFMNNKVPLILVTRDLDSNEREVLKGQKAVPTSLAIAKDAVAVVVNNASRDTFSVSEIRGILTGTYSKKYTVVFDDQNSSTVRFMLDSIIPGEKLGANVFAAKGNDSVIKYVANNPDAIGFVGVSYVSDYNDPEEMAFISSVKVAALLNEETRKYYKPYQAFIAQRLYPLTRNLFYIHRETHFGLGTGFANFLAQERGQLIFKQARLFPLRSNIIIREAAVNPEPQN